MLTCARVDCPAQVQNTGIAFRGTFALTWVDQPDSGARWNIVGEMAIFRQQRAHHFHGLSTRALNLQSSSWGHILVKGVWHSLGG